MKSERDELVGEILVIYGAYTYPLRATIHDHLYCFQRYSEHNCVYYNLLCADQKTYRQIPRRILKQKFDLVVFYVDLLILQWQTRTLDQFYYAVNGLKKMDCPKVAIVQDEHYNPNSIGKFVNDLNINIVFTLAPESEWHKIYPMINFDNVQIFRVLPGYLDKKTLARIDKMAKTIRKRTIDIGYRAYGLRFWLGRHGFIKIHIADVFKQKAPLYNLKFDISTNLEDTFLGDRWFEFLLKCKYTIAVEGGASIIDRDGRLRQKTEEYVMKNPTASFEEVERECFPGQDGNLKYMAISPKHLEACATRTCQVLIAGDYNGILVPGKHYIELKRDMSNIDEVLQIIKADDRRKEIVENAYRDIVLSEKFTYNRFVQFVLMKALGDSMGHKHVNPIDKEIKHKRDQAMDFLSWVRLALRVYCGRLARAIIPQRLYIWLRK